MDALLRTLADLTLSRAAPPAARWFDGALGDAVSPERALALLAGAGRRLGRTAVRLTEAETAQSRSAGLAPPPEGWGLDELGRGALILTAAIRCSAASRRDLARDAFYRGDSRERQAVLRVLAFLPGPEALRGPGGRRLSLERAERVRGHRLRQPVPRALLPRAGLQPAGAQGALHRASPLARIVGLGRAATPGARPHGRGYASERRAAGAAVPADVDAARRRRARSRPRMKLFDPHIHMTSRTTDDYQAMAAAGIAAIVEPAFWLGQPRTHVGTFEDYFLSLLGWERFRASQFGIRHFCTMALNPKEANNPSWRDGVLELLPRYLEKDGVVAVGEIGYDDMTEAEERVLRRADRAGARARAARPRSTRRTATRSAARSGRSRCVRETGASRPSWCSSTTTPRRRCRSLLDSGLLGGPLDLPRTRRWTRRAWSALVKQYGARAHPHQQRRRLGRERSAQGAEDGGTPCARRASARPPSRRSCWSNPVAFFAQSGRLDIDGRRAPGVDQRAALGGQLGAARSDAARRELSSRMRAHPRPRRRRAHARACSASTRRTWPALARAGRVAAAAHRSRPP